MNSQDHFKFWQKAARKIRLRINTGFILQIFLPILAGLALLLGFLLLLFRNLELSPNPLWISSAIAIPVAFTISAFFAKQKFYRDSDAFTLLDAKLKLHNQLTVAHSKHGNWPAPRTIPPLLNWSWQRLAIPPILAAGFLLLAGWIPVRKTEETAPLIPEEPIAWQQIDSWTETLEEQDLFENESLEKWKKQVERLRDQPVEDWYSHSSLEAGDNLRDNIADAIREVHSKLDQAAYSLTTARDSLNQMPSGLQSLLDKQWEKTLSDLQSGALKLTPEMLANLSEIDFSNLEGISQAQIDRLSKMLSEGMKQCEHALNGEPCDGSGKPCAICAGGACTGGPSPSREEDTADLAFKEQPAEIGLDRREGVSNEDLSRAALGQQIGTTQSTPEVDPDLNTAPIAGGEANQPSQGGEAVFHSQFTPEEAGRLQRYFR